MTLLSTGVPEGLPCTRFMETFSCAQLICYPCLMWILTLDSGCKYRLKVRYERFFVRFDWSALCKLSLLDVGINITCIVSYRRSKRFTRGCIPSSIAVYLITRRKKNTCPYIMLAYICICVRDHQWCRPSCSRWYACQVCSWQSHIRFCSRRKRR